MLSIIIIKKMKFSLKTELTRRKYFIFLDHFQYVNMAIIKIPIFFLQFYLSIIDSKISNERQI